MPKLGAYSRKSLSAKEWHKELLLAWLFQTCFKLQTALDRRFVRFGLTFQEAVVLMRCVEAREIVPSRLALVLAKDKGKVTRFIDRLEAAELVKRQANPRDRRYSVIKATPKGNRLAERLAATFDQIRKELFVRVRDGDIYRLGKTLLELHRNAAAMSRRGQISESRRARRIGEITSGLQDETSAASIPPSAVKSGHLILEEREGTDERLIQPEGRRTERQNEQGLTLPTKVVLSR